MSRRVARRAGDEVSSQQTRVGHVSGARHGLRYGERGMCPKRGVKLYTVSSITTPGDELLLSSHFVAEAQRGWVTWPKSQSQDIGPGSAALKSRL